ncbi:MAG TPA: DUF3352 domain-containing protein [Pyrinomonadaceae bacterium]|nr:DUF3352 domain-containing protein [Pyrinomonadaceae bacterium]
MHNSKLFSRILGLFLVGVVLLSPVAAQKRGAAKKPVPPAPTEPVLTFDTLLTDDSYKIYSEIRNVGQLVRSQGFTELVDPIIKLAEPPREFMTVLKWLNSHAEPLASSRIVVASWPSRPKLPSVLIAVEFSNADEAKKFETDLRALMPKLTAKPSPTPAASPLPGNTPTVVTPPAPSGPTENELQYAIKQTGSMVLLTDKPVSLLDLQPRRSKLLFEDPNFALARNRFSSEPIFVYVDVKSIENEQLEQKKKWEKEAELSLRTQVVAQENRQNKNEVEVSKTAVEVHAEVLPSPETSSTPSPDEENPPDHPTDLQTVATAQQPEETANSQMIDVAMMSFWSLIFGGQPKWPEAIGLALAFEDDGYALRALVVNGPENKSNPIPFITQLASGPPLVLAASNVLPADIDLFVSLSVDYPQMYEAMVKSATGAQELSRRGQLQPAAVSQPEVPFAAYEKKLGIKIKDDILPLLGHELAVVLLKKIPAEPKPSPGPEAQPSPADVTAAMKAPDLMPVFAIGVRDKEAVKRMIPRIIDGMGLKGASLLAQTEKREDTELVSYANMFSYAFIGDFLLVAPDAGTTRRAVDSYLSHKTLSSDSNFRNSTRWQPREVQGQVYAGPGAVDLYNPLPNQSAINDKMMALVGQLNPVINPLTYALSNDGMGALHELRLPRNLLLLMIAGISAQPNESPIFANESIAQVLLRTIHSAESAFHASTGKGQYGTLDELEKGGFLTKDMFEKNGYKIEVNVMSNKFEATATPIEYGKTGRLSYFVDESGVLRAGDHAGGAATISDKPID